MSEDVAYLNTGNVRTMPDPAYEEQLVPQALDSRVTLVLIGYRHHKAKPAIVEQFFKESDDRGLPLPKNWEDVDKIKTGSNYLSIHQVKQGTPEW
jgi:hypothetical protein